MEIWKDIPWYEWLYKASNLWRIKSLIDCRWIIREKIRKNLDRWNWYMCVMLFKNKKRKTFMVHRLIVLAFLWESKYPQVNHKNWIKSDNNINNLEYCTSSYNNKHAFIVLWRTSTFMTNNPSKWKFWKDSHTSKKVYKINKQWNILHEYWSIIDASKETWICRSDISWVCRWVRKTAWWFVWKFKT